MVEVHYARAFGLHST